MLCVALVACSWNSAVAPVCKIAPRARLSSKMPDESSGLPAPPRPSCPRPSSSSDHEKHSVARYGLLYALTPKYLGRVVELGGGSHSSTTCADFVFTIATALVRKHQVLRDDIDNGKTILCSLKDSLR